MWTPSLYPWGSERVESRVPSNMKEGTGRVTVGVMSLEVKVNVDGRDDIGSVTVLRVKYTLTHVHILM